MGLGQLSGLKTFCSGQRQKGVGTYCLHWAIGKNLWVASESFFMRLGSFNVMLFLFLLSSARQWWVSPEPFSILYKSPYPKPPGPLPTVSPAWTDIPASLCPLSPALGKPCAFSRAVPKAWDWQICVAPLYKSLASRAAPALRLNPCPAWLDWGCIAPVRCHAHLGCWPLQPPGMLWAWGDTRAQRTNSMEWFLNVTLNCAFILFLITYFLLSF